MNKVIAIDQYIYYKDLKQLLSLYNNKEIVFFCVGNYKVWYDSFASELASSLRELSFKAYIYGGKNFPIVPDNLSAYIDFVNAKHPYACIIVVDNLLTFSNKDCGNVIIRNRASNIAYFSQNLAFGHISLLLKTYPYNNSYNFLNKQSQIVKKLVLAFENLNKSGLIE